MSGTLFDFINIDYSTLLSIWVFFIYVAWFCFLFYNFMVFLAIVHKDVWNITKYLYKKAKLKIVQKVSKVVEAVSHSSSSGSSKEPVPTSFPRLSAAMGGRPPRKNDDDDKKKKKKQKEEAKKQKAKEDAAAAANRIWWIKVGIVTLVGVALVGVYVYNKDQINETIAAILAALGSSGSSSSGGASSGVSKTTTINPVMDVPVVNNSTSNTGVAAAAAHGLPMVPITKSTKFCLVVDPNTIVAQKLVFPAPMQKTFGVFFTIKYNSPDNFAEAMSQIEIRARLEQLMKPADVELIVRYQITKANYPQFLADSLPGYFALEEIPLDDQVEITTLLLHVRNTTT